MLSFTLDDFVPHTAQKSIMNVSDCNLIIHPIFWRLLLLNIVL